MQTKSFLRIIGVTIGILLVPLIAMQFSDEVNWTGRDFVAMGIVLMATGVLLDIVWRKAGQYRTIAVLGVLILFFYVWAELAVGVFTNLGS